jgi:hypothetical protein
VKNGGNMEEQTYADKIAISTENAIKNLFDKTLVTFSASMKNSKYVAAQYALDYVKTDNVATKEKAVTWLQRNTTFKLIITELMNDPLMPQELKDKYALTIDD